MSNREFFKEALGNVAFGSMPESILTLFDAIAHGDARHRAWLKQAMVDHFKGLPVQRMDQEWVKFAERIHQGVSGCGKPETIMYRAYRKVEE